jgi:LuxR family maltose regulon positive regulatory protein
MVHAVGTVVLEQRRPSRTHLPAVPDWVVPRARLSARLDAAVSSPLTVVTGPTGWGKTLGVASWAGTQDPGGVLWLSAAAGEPDSFWELLRLALVETGGRSLAPVPRTGSHGARRTHALALLGTWLRRTGPRVLVVDNYPAGGLGALGDDLEIVLDHARGGLSLVVISRGEPALALPRHHIAGDLTRISVEELAMDRHEVAEVLLQHQVDAAEVTARTVQRHTAGWPCGVRLAALALRTTSHLEDAMRESDRAAVDFFASEVLARTPARVRELLVWTSMVDDVGPDLAREVMGSDVSGLITPGIASEAFTDLRTDGSFRCHPLLRAAAVAELDRRPLEEVRAATRRAARWYVDHDQTTTGLGIAMAREDWTWVARTLVETYAVPRVVAGTSNELVESALAVPAVGAAEPLLEATLLLKHGRPDAAEAVLDLIDRADGGAPGGVADELSGVFLRLAVSRARGDAESGLPLSTRAEELMAHLRVETQRELLAMLDAHVGALELCHGRLDRAEATLRRGAADATEEQGTSGRPLDCLGQLALLEGFRGNLRQAERQATAVLRGSPPEAHAGVAHAHLAMAWVHLDRAEHVPARQHLDRALRAAGDEAEPWYHTAQLLAEARLLEATDQSDAAVRLLFPAMGGEQPQAAGTEWTRGLVTLEAAKALASAGEPDRALDLIARSPASPRVESALLTAQVLVTLGEMQRARAELRPVMADLPRSPLDTQVTGLLLDARVEHEVGDADRARMLVDRALRDAEREMMRGPVTQETDWLLPVVEDDPALRRTHGGFLAGLRSSSLRHPDRGPVGDLAAPMFVETLTVREAQVLGLLSEMYSTEEIATELYLSVNTVKTYVRGILRKLCVNRRVEAVRRGRELGLC